MLLKPIETWGAIAATGMFGSNGLVALHHLLGEIANAGRELLAASISWDAGGSTEWKPSTSFPNASFSLSSWL